MANVGDITDRAEFRSDDGSVTLNMGDAGSLLAASGAGSVVVNFGAVEGDAELSSDDGDVVFNMGSAEAARARTGAGKVEANVRSSVGDMELATDDGEVRLTIPDSFACSIDAETDDGRVIFECDLDDGHDTSDEHVTGDRNGGGASVRLRAGAGDITISVG